MLENLLESISDSEKEENGAVDLVEIRKDLISRLDKFEKEEKSLGLDYAGIAKRRQKIEVDFLEELLGQKEKFKFIFKTAQGSVYFVSENDQSFRFKMEDSKFDNQPILDKIIFLSLEEKDRLFEIKNSELFQERLIGYKLKKEKFSKGVFPIEFGINHMRKVAFIENDKELEILGTQTEEGVEPFFASGIHIGNSVAEIIKE